MGERTPSGTAAQPSDQQPVTQVTLTFNRQVTEEEVRQMQSQHNAISAALAELAADHHDHDHKQAL